METNQVILNLIKIVRRDPSVRDLQKLDPKTEIYVQKLEKSHLMQLNQDYPNFIPTGLTNIFSINVISSKMVQNIGYKKIRFYINPNGKILKRIES